MIRMIPSSPGQAKAYFSDALSKSDYYMNDQELQGTFQGKLADRLKIAGPATKEVFFRLCENKHPTLRESLTPNTRNNRITGWDISYHAPKSLSILHALSKDNHLLKAFEGAVKDAMDEIEKDVKTRVRKNNQYDDRKTGEILYAGFTHQTSRAVGDQVPDPHMHRHCFLMNVAWDDIEEQYKAAKVRDIKRDMPYYQTLFHKGLSDRLIKLGYQVKRTKTSFEIIGVPQKIIDHFSKRTNEIGRIAKEKGITDPEALDALGAQTRSKKQKGTSMETLKAAWKKQLQEVSKDIDLSGLGAVRYGPVQEKKFLRELDCVDYALSDAFERKSVAHDRRVIEKAFRLSIGYNNVSIQGIRDSFYTDQRLIQIEKQGMKMLTTKEVLAEEKQMVALAKMGKGAITPLYKSPPTISLNEQQTNAVKHILTTQNRLSIVMGAAGTGKTKLMTEAVKHIEQAGKKVIVVAPTAQASRVVLKNEGFKEAETVAKLINDKSMQESLSKQVLWVDEAGILSNREMLQLLEIVQKQDAQLILGGDTRQHTSVARGDALRILNTVGKIQAAEVNKIYRQKNHVYRSAVEDLSKGRILGAFEKLESLGGIKTIDITAPHNKLADDYTAAIRKGKTALIVSPTHEQGEAVSHVIRKRLQELGRIGKKEWTFQRLINCNWTQAQKSDPNMYRPGQTIQFNQNCKGIKRGSVFTILKNEDTEITLKDQSGKSLKLPEKAEAYFDVFDASEIKLSKGDAVRITKNAFDLNQKRIDNGTSLIVSRVDKKGNIILSNKVAKTKFELPNQFGHIAHDYCVTSHSSQGKTVDEVFIAQPSSTFEASNLKQFYVSVSRGREKVHIYTDDKEVLLENVSELGNRQSALELLESTNDELKYVLEKQQKEYAEKLSAIYKQNKDVTVNPIEREYEPDF